MSDVEQTTTEKPDHVRQAEALRKLADFIEANEDVAPRFWYSFDSVNIFPSDDDPAAEMAKLIRLGLAAGATVTKNATDRWMIAKLDFGGRVAVDVVAGREQVCTRREVGREVRKVRETVEVEKEVPIYEWDCSPILAGGDS